jgi:hypothetical protein
MPTASRNRVPKRHQRRALTLAGCAPKGCTEAIMPMHGFTVEIGRAGHSGQHELNGRSM